MYQTTAFNQSIIQFIYCSYKKITAVKNVIKHFLLAKLVKKQTEKVVDKYLWFDIHHGARGRIS